MSCTVSEFKFKDQKFIIASSPLSGGSLLFISDYIWWGNNEREILNWMAEHLPRGIEHQQGMVITFDNDQDRLMFMLRWG